MLRRVVFVMVTWMFMVATTVAQTSPVTLLQKNSDAIIAALLSNQINLTKDAKKVYQIVDKIFVRPHVALDLMARQALGPVAWRQATPVERQRFSRLFADLLIHTYASALAQYTNEKIKYFPLRGGYEGKTKIQVDSAILRTAGPRILVNYKLVAQGNTWKVYDIAVEGISITNSFRTQFATVLANRGMSGLIKQLEQHNAQF